MICNCPDTSYTLLINEGVATCTKITTIDNITCPEGCIAIDLGDGNVKCDCEDTISLTLTDSYTAVSLSDPTYFKDVSFTLAYSPILNKWISYYSFTPNYYVEHQNYFQTGINSTVDPAEQGLWSHLLTNQSYQVFYGKRQPFIVDFTTKNSFLSKKIDSLSLSTNTRRYHNNYDWAEIENRPLSALTIYNSTANSGEIRMVNNTGAMRMVSDYPKTAVDGKSQEVLTSYKNEQWFVNYFYNRVIDNNTNIPLWKWDDNQINKVLNTDVIKFSGKPVLEKLTGPFFNVRLTQDKESRFQYIYRFSMANEQIER
jgi:hypothetical protein